MDRRSSDCLLQVNFEFPDSWLQRADSAWCAESEVRMQKRAIFLRIESAFGGPDEGLKVLVVVLVVVPDGGLQFADAAEGSPQCVSH